MTLTDYQILLINNGLLLSNHMSQKQAHNYIQTHPDFLFKDAAL